MLDREQLGQMVHEVWVACEQQFAHADPEHLVSWEELNEWEKEMERKIGERLAQAIRSLMTSPISLAGIEQSQIMYNGQFSYLLQEYHPPVSEWCHVLVLKNKRMFSKQMLVILTQQPGGSASISRVIAGIAGYAMTFFGNWSLSDETSMRPETTTFIEYLPVGCFGPDSGPTKETFAVLEFDWKAEESPDGGYSSYQAHNPQWHLLTRETVQELIERL